MISVDRCAEVGVECPMNCVTNYGRVWRKDGGKPGLECEEHTTVVAAWSEETKVSKR